MDFSSSVSLRRQDVRAGGGLNWLSIVRETGWAGDGLQ